MQAGDKYTELYKTGPLIHFGLIGHPEHKWLGGSPDGVTADGVLVEIKCPYRRDISPQVPEYYIPQVQLLMQIMDLDTCHFVQYRPESAWNSMELVVTVVPRDEAWWDRYFPVMKGFYDEWQVLQADRETALARFPPPKPRGPREPRPSPWDRYRFCYEPIPGLPSGADDEFFARPEDPSRPEIQWERVGAVPDEMWEGNGGGEWKELECLILELPVALPATELEVFPPPDVGEVGEGDHEAGEVGDVQVIEEGPLVGPQEVHDAVV